MPCAVAVLVSARWVVLPIQPLAGSVHHGGNPLLPFGLLHLSWPAVGPGSEPVGSSPEQFGPAFKAEVERFVKIVNDLKLPPQD